jgi:ubiquinone/menaquinone biosynthesis C-methylase UbiE
MMKNGIFGNRMDRMPDVAFRMMSAIFRLRDMFVSPGNLLDEFHIREGQVVVDYGCGPGSYISRASKLVGENGKVLAVDIHELAIEAIERRALKENLPNVSAHLVVNGKCPLADDTADIIYAMDMFHMVGDAKSFLRELNRISKPNGLLFIDNGHQSREEARKKIHASGKWDILEEKKRYLKCRPK